MSLQGIKDKFLNGTRGRAAAGMLSLSALLPFAPPAEAETLVYARDMTREEYDRYDATGTEADARSFCTLPHKGYECASAEFEEPMTAEDIIQSGIGKHRVIYHFGKGLLDAGISADINNTSGVPTLAIPGGPDNGVDIYLNGKLLNRRPFTQTEMNGAAVNAAVQKRYKKVMARLNIDPSTVPINPRTFNNGEGQLTASLAPSAD